MNEETLYEVTSYPININKNEEATCAWHNTMVTVRSEKGMHFYEIDHNFESLDKKINCLQTYLPSVKSRVTAKMFTEKVINSSLRNIDYNTMIQDHSLWPHNQQLVEEMTCVVSFEWSPLGLLPSNESVLAVLNNIGGVDLFIHSHSTWRHMLEVIQQFSDSFLKMRKDLDEFSVLKATAHALSSTAMCWSPILTHNKCCYLATAQKNDSVMIWLISCKDLHFQAKFQAKFDNVEGEIVAMKWVCISESKFIIICSNIYGQIYLLVCEVNNNKIKKTQTSLIWPDKDKMVTRYMQVKNLNDKMVLICNKHRLLVMLMIDENLNVCGQYVKNVNDYRLTSVTNSTGEIYFTTVNCKIYRIGVEIKDNQLCGSFYPVEFKGLSSTCELYDMSFSRNGVICTLVIVDRKITFRKEPFKINVVFATTNKILDSLVNILLRNPSNKLTDYWDVVELLRYKCMKCKNPPLIDYSQIYNNACQNIYQLKLYLIFVTFYYNLKRQFKIEPMDDIPQDSLDIIKEEILVNHAESLLRRYNTKRSVGPLEALEKECLWGVVNFLEYYCRKNDKNLYEVVKKESLDEIEMDFTCQGCDEKIQGFSCSNGHLNMFCTLTFTPIEGDDYLSCVWCQRTARLELYPENPMCLFCDVSLIVQE